MPNQEEVARGYRPKGKGKGKGRNSWGDERVDWKGYISPRLPSASRKAFDQFANNGKAVAEAFLRELGLRRKYSVSYDVSKEAYRATLYCQNTSLPSAGYCLSVFASDPDTAYVRLMFLAEVGKVDNWQQWITPVNPVDEFFVD